MPQWLRHTIGRGVHLTCFVCRWHSTACQGTMRFQWLCVLDVHVGRGSARGAGARLTHSEQSGTQPQAESVRKRHTSDRATNQFCFGDETEGLARLRPDCALERRACGAGSDLSRRRANCLAKTIWRTAERQGPCLESWPCSSGSCALPHGHVTGTPFSHRTE